MKLEDFDVWRLARQLTREIYEVSSLFPKEEVYGLKSQIRRSAASIAGNIAEGFGRYHYLSKINFYYNARGSLEETKSHFFIAYDQKYVSDAKYKNIQKEMTNVGIKLNNTINAAYKQKPKNL